MRMSLLATFPELRDWERRHGSLLRGAKAAAGSAGEEKGHKPIFATVWGGLSRLADRLVEAIGDTRVKMGWPAQAIRAEPDGFSVVAGGSGEQSVRADAVILATPAYRSAGLVRDLNPKVAGELAGISYVSTAVILLSYPPGTASRLPEGTGFVVPEGEATITACTWVSRKWPREDFGDRAVLRCFAGRAGAEEALELPDEELVSAVAREVEEATPLGVNPTASRVVRWDRSMPQYEVGHLGRVTRIETALGETPGLFLAGSAYRGVGIPDCIRQGEDAAEQVVAFLGSNRVSGGEQQEAISWKS